MTNLNIEILKKIIQDIPNDFILEYVKGDIVVPIDKIEIDISIKRIIFK